jgi:hypothetical protein
MHTHKCLLALSASQTRKWEDVAKGTLPSTGLAAATSVHVQLNVCIHLRIYMAPCTMKS